MKTKKLREAGLEQSKKEKTRQLLSEFASNNDKQFENDKMHEVRRANPQRFGDTDEIISKGNHKNITNQARLPNHNFGASTN